jgi:ribose/xylose/arabinose/galactoside ABC-type transport system permease subunit
MLSGSGLHVRGMELDVIASMLLGSNLLTGGVGRISGNVVDVLLLGDSALDHL